MEDEIRRIATKSKSFKSEVLNKVFTQEDMDLYNYY